MTEKRIVFIIDEAHRSTFGDMLRTIKETFPMAIFFGFTGTPIKKDNQKKMNTTATVFGNELHRYSIADGIRDHNVLGFDPYRVMTYKDSDIREKVALSEAKAATVEEAINDEKKAKIYYHFMSASEIGMAGYEDDNENYIKGIEDYLSRAQYDRKEHHLMVVEDIKDKWMQLSRNGKFHAIFATSSIAEAIKYYKLIKEKIPELKITALFDPNIDNKGNVKFKEDALIEIIEDYNLRYEQDFKMATHAKFKKDIASRLSHKAPYTRIHKTTEKQIDLLIVVDQMLTGFDSKWLNTLYLDKVLKYENVIQAFSRTNRLFGPDKPFGTIRYYRYPHTMERNIEAAVKSYSGDCPFGIFVDPLEHNLNKMNSIIQDIEDLFKDAGIQNFEKIPDDKAYRGQFVKLFKEFNDYLEAARVQGFKWSQSKYEICDENDKAKSVVEMKVDETTYLILALRYKELFTTDVDPDSTDSTDSDFDVAFEIDGYLTEIDTGVINSGYMESNFNRFKKLIAQNGDNEELKNQVLSNLHKSFASLTQEEQKYANIFLHDVASENILIDDNKSFRDYVAEYQFNAKNDQLHKMAENLGLDEKQLVKIMNAEVTEKNINAFGRFDALKKSVDDDKAIAYFEKIENIESVSREGNGTISKIIETNISKFTLHIMIDKLLRKFILNDE